MSFSKEYLASIALLVGAVLKIFDIELENGVVEGLIAGAVALFIAISRKAKGDINIVGAKVR